MTDHAPPDEESLRLELREAITTFRDQAGRMTQGTGFIVTADSVLLAYGFSQRESGILLVASAMPVLALLVYIHFRRIATPILYVAMILERQLRLNEVPLIGIYARQGFKQLRALVASSTGVANDDVLNSILTVSYRDWVVRPIPLAFYGIFVAQLSLFVISLVVYNYRFM
jgi:hypothetical protein